MMLIMMINIALYQSLSVSTQSVGIRAPAADFHFKALRNIKQ